MTDPAQARMDDLMPDRLDADTPLAEDVKGPHAKAKPCPNQPHRHPQGPNEDVSSCPACGALTYEMRPEGETYGDHLSDCALPLRHESYCQPGGAGHPTAPVIRGFWPDFVNLLGEEPGLDGAVGILAAKIAAHPERHDCRPKIPATEPARPSETPEAQVTEYTVSAFQEDQINGHHWRIRIRRTPSDWWVIQWGGEWLQQDRTWYPDPHTALRYRDEHDAIAVAREALKALDVNGTTWADMVQRCDEQP
jgi:hypothetical protein